MVDWKKELSIYIAKKMQDLGYDIKPDDLTSIELFDVTEFEELDVEDLGIVYAFALMDENFEKANLIKREIEKRDHEIIIHNHGETSIIRISDAMIETVPYFDIHMKNTKDGLVMDFEKQNF